MVYLIICSENDTCKIGYTNNPKQRLSALQVGNPYALELAKVTPFKNKPFSAR